MTRVLAALAEAGILMLASLLLYLTLPWIACRLRRRKR